MAVCAFIEKDGQILAVARRGTEDQWGLPGGKVDAGEDPMDALVREVQEETGLSLDKENLEEVLSAPDGPFEVITYRYNGAVGKPRQGDAGPVEWVSWDELLNGPFGSYNAKLLSVI